MAAVIITIVSFDTESGIEKLREEFIAQKVQIIGLMDSQGNYSCCLEKPCTYCIEKSPGHGKGAECHCGEDVLNGVHPCEECIGEILEGHGRPELAPYYAKAIAEKVGPEFEDELQQMITIIYFDKTEDSMSLRLSVEKNKDDLQQITCYCGCDHTDLYDCYEEDMLTNCGVCMNEYNDYQALKQEGKSIKEISQIIYQDYGN